MLCSSKHEVEITALESDTAKTCILELHNGFIYCLRGGGGGGGGGGVWRD